MTSDRDKLVKMVASKKPASKQRRNNKQRARVVVGRVTAAEAQYAKLLADPCNGPLVSGPFGDGGGGFVSRFESDIIINNTLLQTCAALAFVPGEPKVFTSGTNLTIEDQVITWSDGSAFTPGFGFLNANASQFRCLAACIQVYWPGTELNRQGIVSVGQASGEAVLTDGVLTPRELRIASTYVERTPAGMMELKWRPSEYDTMWSEFNTEREGVIPALVGKKSAIFVSGAGLPTDVGLRVRIVAVYEWKPKMSIGSGLVVPTGYGQVKQGSLQGTLAWLDSLGDWMYSSAHTVGVTASKLAAGVGSIMSTATGAARLGRAMLSLA